jgi:NAD(P)-dependent dehydrogenase (short-subunit alcohol dehydrogenase family)
MGERRVALINQTGTYVGPALARRMARVGYDLVLTSPRPGQVEALEGLGATVESVGSANPAAPSKQDETTESGWRGIVDAALRRFGRLDAAALLPASNSDTAFARGPILAADVSDLHALTGYFETTFHALRAVIPAMRTSGGQILVFTSDAGVRPEANWSLYGAVRAGQSFLVQAVALEHAGEGIMINALGSKNAVFDGFPGAPADDITDSKAIPGEWSAPLEAETPLGRVGTMEELAAFAQVLLDGTNRFQTAQYFSYSGGWNIR